MHRRVAEWLQVAPLRSKQFTYACITQTGASCSSTIWLIPTSSIILSTTRSTPASSAISTGYCWQMRALDDTFEQCTWYEQHWTKDRLIMQTATLP